MEKDHSVHTQRNTSSVSITSIQASSESNIISNGGKNQLKKKRKKSTTKSFELELQKSAKKKYLLRLYVTGINSISKRAIVNLKRICDQHLKGRYDLEVIDIYQYPSLAKGEQIIATPTLVKILPQPIRKIIGDLSDKKKVLLGLDIRPYKKSTVKKK